MQHYSSGHHGNFHQAPTSSGTPSPCPPAEYLCNLRARDASNNMEATQPVICQQAVGKGNILSLARMPVPQGVCFPLYTQDHREERSLVTCVLKVCVDFRLGNPLVDILPKPFML
jgi:hypothetical protein